MAQALPNNINLAAQKPNAVPSYVRRFRNIQTNSNGNNGEQSDIIIPIDTGTPGAFLDCQQCYLQMDLTIINANPYVDYVNFGRAGANSVFEVMTLKANGTPIETIRDYNTVFENWMAIEGLSQAEFSLYHSRKNSQLNGGWVDNTVNNCKKPMVDWSGRIMDSIAYSAASWTQIPNIGTPVSNNTVGTNTSWADGFQSGALATTTNVASTIIGPQNPQYNYIAGGDIPPQNDAPMSVPFGGVIIPWLNGNYRGQVNLPGTLVLNQYDSNNINFWPNMIGVEMQNKHLHDQQSLRTQDYMTFLSNVKCIPVGCRTTVPTSANGAYMSPTPAGSTTPNYIPGQITMTVTLPLLSGLIGLMAQKMAPTMLLDDFQLVMTTTNNAKAFKVTMDPCRRIPGTHRDFLVYYGNMLGPGNSQAAAGLPLANQWIPSVMNSRSTLNNWGTPAVAPYIGTSASSGLVPGTLGFIATDQQYISSSLLGTAPLNTVTTPNSFPYFSVTQAPYFQANSGIPQYYHSSLCVNGIFPSQYYGSLATNAGNDGYGCYGTYLESSEPQTARCIRNTGLTAAPDVLSAAKPYPTQFTDSNQGVLTAMPRFLISNVYFVATQVIIPDEITAEILQAATRGDISIQTHTIQVWNQITLSNGSPSQNIVIPAKVGSANSLFGIFRTNEQTSNSVKQYLVNSLMGYNPIGYAVYSADNASYIGTNNEPRIGYVPTTAGAFSFQLKIGNDLVPAQPINSIAECVTELEKCSHGLNVRYNNESFNSAMFPRPRTDVASAGSAPDNLVHDLFLNGGYCTTYVDPFMLQDQTIVNKYLDGFMQVSPVNNPAAPTVLYTTAPNTFCFVPVGSYIVPKLVHPDGGFILGIDLDTWSGMSETALSGRYLGNNPVSLACDGLGMIQQLGASSSAGQQNTVNFTAIIPCDARWSFQAGGNSQVFI